MVIFNKKLSIAMSDTTYISYGGDGTLYPPKILNAYELIEQTYDELFAYIKHEELERIFADQDIYNRIYNEAQDLTYIINISNADTCSYLISYIRNNIDNRLAYLEQSAYNHISGIDVNNILSTTYDDVAYVNITAYDIPLNNNIPQNTSYITYNDNVQTAIIKLAYNIDMGVRQISLGAGTEIDLNLFA